MRTQQQELAQAAKEQRQPICIGCKQPLDVVRQVVSTYHTWSWDQMANRFRKHEALGDPQTAYHAACGHADTELVEYGPAASELGLVY